MATKQIAVERFSVVSAKPFTEVVRAIEAQVGRHSYIHLGSKWNHVILTASGQRSSRTLETA